MNNENLFFKPLKLQSNAESRVWFLSDLHMGHDREFLYGKRGFRDIQEHDRTMIVNWNKRVSHNDIVFHLGDIMFGRNGETRLPSFLRSLNFKTVFLMGGNHTAGYSQIFRSADKDFRVYLDGTENGRVVQFIPNYFEVYVNGQPIVLSHYPIGSWNGQSKGSFHIAGHSHGNYQYTMGKMLDVGIENFLGPVSFDEIKSILDSKEIVVTDHHDGSTTTPFS